MSSDSRTRSFPWHTIVIGVLTVGLVAILEVYPSGARIAALLRNRLDERPGLPDLVPDAGLAVAAAAEAASPTSDVAPAPDDDARA